MFVYMIGAFTPKKLAFLKVGVTKDVNKRIKAIQTGQGLEVRLICAWQAKGRLHAFDVEAATLREFGRDRMYGEWFRAHAIRKIRAYLTARMGREPTVVGHNSNAARRAERTIPLSVQHDLKVMAWMRANGF